MDALDVSRWQFGITTVYHFLFVPLTIGLAPLIAVMQTAWVITDNGGVVVQPPEDTPYGRLAAAVAPTGAMFNLSSLQN